MIFQDKTIVDETRAWISNMVIGLNLCPFAQRVFDAELVRYSVTDATTRRDLEVDLIAELEFLLSRSSSEVDTTLLIHPQALVEFEDYNDYLGVADRLLHKLGMDDAIQIASFHPRYEFSNASADAVENYTNRSPYPMLHLLRVESVARVVHNPEAVRAIPARNIELLRKLGIDEVRRLSGEDT